MEYWRIFQSKPVSLLVKLILKCFCNHIHSYINRPYVSLSCKHPGLRGSVHPSHRIRTSTSALPQTSHYVWPSTPLSSAAPSRIVATSLRCVLALNLVTLQLRAARFWTWMLEGSAAILCRLTQQWSTIFSPIDSPWPIGSVSMYSGQVRWYGTVLHCVKQKPCMNWQCFPSS